MGMSTALALVRSGQWVTPLRSGCHSQSHGIERRSAPPHPTRLRPFHDRLRANHRQCRGRVGTDVEALGQRHLHPTGTLVLARDDSLMGRVYAGGDGVRASRPPCSTETHSLPPTRGWTPAASSWPHGWTRGVLMAEAIIRGLARHLLMHGVTVNTHTPVVDVNPVRGAVTLRTVDPTRRSRRRRCGSLGSRPRAQRDQSSQAQPAGCGLPHASRATRRRLALAPMVLDIHGAGGIYVVPPVAGSGLKVGDHSFSLKGHPGRDSSGVSSRGGGLFEALAVGASPGWTSTRSVRSRPASTRSRSTKPSSSMPLIAPC